jgi:protein-L-isoaspartate(D-aspartate) O-methyltransferase
MHGSWIAVVLFGAAIAACTSDGGSPSWGRSDDRDEMVAAQIEARGVSDTLVLRAMRSVPRHRFVPEHFSEEAYGDYPLPIGEGQTISQPYVVAAMTEAARVRPGEKVLEIGTGSGYQAAVLAAMGAQVWSIEIIPTLAARADSTLSELGYEVSVLSGDGYRGWPEHAPFDAVVVTAAPEHVPQPLVDQLAVGGRLVIPVGDYFQELIVMTKLQDGTTATDTLFPVRFVPMTGEAEDK